jgi:hypothetical protein
MARPHRYDVVYIKKFHIKHFSSDVKCIDTLHIVLAIRVYTKTYLVNWLDTKILSRMYLNLENLAPNRYIFWHTNKPQVLASWVKLTTCKNKQQLGKI